MKNFIAVAGNIGTGKTSLVRFLSSNYDLKPFFEPNEKNPYLTDFYRDMRRYAFRSQVYFLTHKYRLHRDLERYPGTVIQDRTIYEDAEIFAKNLHRSRYLNKRDYATYRELYETIRKDLAPPDVMIFLRCPMKTMRQRIAKRGRRMEKQISYRYLKNLELLYSEWIAAYQQSPIIQIESDRMDYVSNLVDRLDLLSAIEKFI